MKRNLWASMAVALLAIAITASAEHERRDLLKFDHMIGVSGPYVGPNNPIRGVPGGNAPWVIREGRGELESNGELEVHVRGLVLPSFGNINVVPTIRGLVSCQIIDDAGNPGILNVSTRDFPFSQSGDADLEAKLALPTSCIAPVIFVTHPEGRWFATIGY
jgi:hypothetical protein